MNEKVTVDSIIETLTQWVEEKEPITPSKWLDAAQKLIVLMGSEHDRLFDIQQAVNYEKSLLISAGGTAASAKVRVEASDLYKEYCKQKAKIERLEGQISVSKAQARMKDNEYRNQ